MTALRVLVISGSPWSANNSFGNTYQTIFDAAGDIELCSIYCAEGVPDPGHVVSAFQITESSLIRNLLDRSFPSGQMLGETRTDGGRSAEPGDAPRPLSLEGITESARRYRFYFYELARVARSVIWRLGRWASPELERFVHDAAPDLVFFQIGNASHLRRLALWAHRLTGAPLVGHIVDDPYSLKQVSFSPLFWATRLKQRSQIREIVAAASMVYVITDQQREEYQNMLHRECKVLTKLADFRGEVDCREPSSPDGVVWFTYAGNIGNGRVESLRRIAKAIDGANRNGGRGRLRIYTMTPVTRRMRQRLRLPVVELYGAVDPEDLKEVYNTSSVLVLVEPVDLRGRLSVRLSFSTKIVEYMRTGRCILAYGSGNTASIQYLEKSRAAMVVKPEDSIDAKIEALIRDEGMRRRYAKDAWSAGRRNHDASLVGAWLGPELRRLAAGGANENTSD